MSDEQDDLFEFIAPGSRFQLALVLRTIFQKVLEPLNQSWM